MGTQAPEIKEFLQRSDIKTMKKDLKRLREADTVFTDQKPLKITEKEQPEPIKFNSTQGLGLAKKQIPANIILSQEERKKATEAEKQQIFLWESQQQQLKNQLAGIESKKTRLWEEKNKIIKEKESLEQQIGGIAEDKNTKNKKWEKEQQLAALEKTLQNNNQQSAFLAAEKEKTSRMILQLQEKLKRLQNDLKARKEFPTTPLSKPRQPIIPPVAGPTPQSRKEHLKMASEAIREKIQVATQREEEQRRKFMEDVEKWASSNKLRNN